MTNDPPSSPGPWLFRRVPALDSLRGYSRANLASDLSAGLTVATVAVPQAMAYATLAGLPPQYGLYTAIVMTAVGALLDSSRLLINGPTNAISIALLSALAVVPESERVSAAIALAFLVGSVQIGIALLRLGDLTRFVSHSVIVGFTLGASMLLVLDQTKHLLGLQSMGTAADHFLIRFWRSITEGGRPHGPTVLVGVATILLVVGFRRLNQVLVGRGFRFPIPQHLVAVSLVALLAWSLKLHERGVQIVGAIPPDLPAFAVPDLKSETVRLMAGSAFAIALLGLLEAVAMAKAIAARAGQNLDVNQHCRSAGAANQTGSLFQCFPGSGSLTRSAVNQQAGAVSQWSGVFAALAVAATVLLLAPLAGYIPRASLAGLLILAGYRMIDGPQLRFHLRATRFDAGVVIATALAAILISIEFCILIGVFLSFALFVSKAAHVRLSQSGEMGPTRTFELDGELFFGAEAELTKHFATIASVATGDVREVVLDLTHGRNPDAGFFRLLLNLHEQLKSRSVALNLIGARPEVVASLDATRVAEAIGPNRIQAVETAAKPSVQLPDGGCVVDPDA